jgi:hypothetical protein
MEDGSLKSPLPGIYVVGAPGPVGGADTELWHTLRLWRQRGQEVAVIPTWAVGTEWRQKCEAIGCTVHEVAGPAQLLDVPGLKGSLVISFCNGAFLSNVTRLRQAGCRLIWVNCMTWMFEAEKQHYRQHGPFDHYVFQSRHQASRLVPQLEDFGYRASQGTIVRGAFMWDEFPFRPLAHDTGTTFVIGRISRADVDKYSSNTWPIYGRVPYPVRARLMAWDKRIEQKLGKPPDWAECLPVASERPQDFFAKLHCMLQVNGGAGENWPRSGLEAMACGVPVVVQNQWGWREMIRHGETGYLADDDNELAFYTAKLAYEEDVRLSMAQRARRALEEELASPDVLWVAWEKVFRQALEGRPPAKDKTDQKAPDGEPPPSPAESPTPAAEVHRHAAKDGAAADRAHVNRQAPAAAAPAA